MHLILYLFVACLARSHALANSSSAAQAKPIVIDTDIYSDVDDVGSLTVANVLHNCGFADLRGVVINTHSKYGALAASVINSHFDNGDVPIGAIRPLTNETFFDDNSYTNGEYASKVAYNWPRTLNDSSQTPNPVELYRQILTSAEDTSVTIISIGFLTNLAALLNSTADQTNTTGSNRGVDLVSAKVKELVVMGGYYPSGWEFNFGGSDPASTKFVIENWPASVPITFSGGELGGNIYTGQHLSSHSPPNSPVLAAYQWYVTRCSTIRESWDPLTTLYGILGLDGFATLGLKSPFVFANDIGYNTVLANGSNAWVNDSSVTNQHWLKLADGVRNDSVAWMLDQLFVHDPVDLSCF